MDAVFHTKVRRPENVMRKTKEEAEISRQKILDAAEAAFRKKGYVSAKMDDIARVTGMTKGAIFWHFESKAGLFKAVVERSVQRFGEIFREGFATSGPIIERYRRILIRIRHDRVFELLLVVANEEAMSGIPKKALADIYRQISEIFKIVLINLQEAKKKGEIRPDVDILDILIPIVLIMSGFAKLKEITNILALSTDQFETDGIIDALFNGLFSFQKQETGK